MTSAEDQKIYCVSDFIPDLSNVRQSIHTAENLCNLATLCMQGKTEPHDIIKVCEYIEMAAALDHAWVQYTIGWWYLTGFNTVREVKLGKHLIRQSASQGNRQAMTKLIHIL